MGEDFECLILLSAVDKEKDDIALFSIFSMLGATFALKPLRHTHPWYNSTEMTNATSHLHIHLNAVIAFYFFNPFKVGKHSCTGDSHSIPVWEVFSFPHLELRAVWGIHHSWQQLIPLNSVQSFYVKHLKLSNRTIQCGFGLCLWSF